MKEQEDRKPEFVAIHEYDIDVRNVDKFSIWDHVRQFLLEKGYTREKANELGQKAQWQYDDMVREMNKGA